MGSVAPLPAGEKIRRVGRKGRVDLLTGDHDAIRVASSHLENNNVLRQAAIVDGLAAIPPPKEQPPSMSFVDGRRRRLPSMKSWVITFVDTLSTERGNPLCDLPGCYNPTVEILALHRKFGN
jgi:hypothetical protein